MKKKLMTIVIVGIAIMTSMASEAAQIDGSTITATAQGTWHTTTASSMVNAREVGEQFMATDWDTTPFPDMYGASDYDDGWLLFELDGDYDLEEIRLWNGCVAHTDEAFRNEWYAKNLSIHVGTSAAVAPTTDGGSPPNYFTGAGWTNIWDGDLAQGPLSMSLAENDLVDPQLVLDATAYTGIRYVAIDHDSNWGTDPNNITLLGHIQIDGAPVPEPTTLGLLGLGGCLVGLFLLRRKR